MLQPSWKRATGFASTTNTNLDSTQTFDAGDFVVYIGFGSDRLMQPQTPSFPGLTFTQRMSAVGFTGYGCLAMWTAPVSTTATGTLTARASWGGTGGNAWCWHLQVYRNVFAYRDYWQARGSGVPQFTNVTQWEHNSCFVWACVDWNVVDGASRSYVAPSGGNITEMHYSRDNQQTTYAARAYNLGEPGAMGTWGLGAPGGQKWSQGAIELYGPLNPKSYEKQADGSLLPVTVAGEWNGATLTPVTYEFKA